jgi:metal-responsive CopG/Arc/MetJ family transcriptional regulator
MEGRERSGNTLKSQNTRTVRASISFPLEVHETLEGIAKEKKVSFAWVVREAAERYIADRWPLFKERGKME